MSSSRKILTAAIPILVLAAMPVAGRVRPLTQSKLPYMTPANIKHGLPRTLPPERFNYSRYIESGYRIAKRIPEAVAQQPCLCPCQKAGHRSLLDCFASEHAASCDICQREVHFVAKKADEGASPEAIRALILKGQY